MTEHVAELVEGKLLIIQLSIREELENNIYSFIRFRFEMGVKRLTSFFKENKNILLADFKLKDTKIIIDGTNMVYALYEFYSITYDYGGNYDEYARRCKQFINNMRDANVVPYIVFDGGHEIDDRDIMASMVRKRNMFRRMKQGYEHGKPILCQQIFRNVLTELSVAHVSCIYAADHEIAVLANKWECPVVSNDSDFFIYALEGGFIPAEYFVGRSVLSEENGHKFIPTKYFHYATYQTYCRTQEIVINISLNYILPMFATIMGNDYTDLTMLEQFYKEHNIPLNLTEKVTVIFRWLSTTNSENDVITNILSSVRLGRNATKEAIIRSINNYKHIEEFRFYDLELFFKGTGDIRKYDLSDKYGRKLPNWFVEKMIKSNTGYLVDVAIDHRVFFEFQIEWFEKISSYACSRNLRAVMYGILLKGSHKTNVYVKEYDRKELEIKRDIVEPEFKRIGVHAIPTLLDVPTMSLEERKSLFFASLGFQVNYADQEQSLSEQSLATLCIISYWVKNSQPNVSESHVRALLVCIAFVHINCLDSALHSDHNHMFLADIFKSLNSTSIEERKMNFIKSRMRTFLNKNGEFPPGVSVNILHGFAQLQTTFMYAVQLNQVLLNPVEIPSPSSIINGSFLHTLCRFLDDRAHADNYLKAVFREYPALDRLISTWIDIVHSLQSTSSITCGRQQSSTVPVKQ